MRSSSGAGATNHTRWILSSCAVLWVEHRYRPPHGRYPHKCTKEHTGKKDTGARNVEEVDVGDTWVAHMGCIVAGARRRYPLWVSSGCSSRPIDSARRGQCKSSPAARPPVSMTSCARATYESPPLVGRTAKGPTIASQDAAGRRDTKGDDTEVLRLAREGLQGRPSRRSSRRSGALETRNRHALTDSRRINALPRKVYKGLSFLDESFVPPAFLGHMSDMPCRALAYKYARLCGELYNTFPPAAPTSHLHTRLAFPGSHTPA
ncbi:hypothetical protein BD626DRAFT_151747 [Schizophyllum amplum]|uniref:Uncharacterized protein n=1 Tax=Schizophyllum amplum TaxID=97359 RepID=A0A550C4C4_9AGAR|nr:hypothetical protein BD626DRAFT_151747 [Auriculariopsis ampla]